eukprot:670896-Rhodomonas_salina.5
MQRDTAVLLDDIPDLGYDITSDTPTPIRSSDFHQMGRNPSDGQLSLSSDGTNLLCWPDKCAIVEACTRWMRDMMEGCL